MCAIIIFMFRVKIPTITLPKFKLLLLGFCFLILGSLIGFVISTKTPFVNAVDVCANNNCPPSDGQSNTEQTEQGTNPHPTSQGITVSATNPTPEPEVQGVTTQATPEPTSQPTQIQQPSSTQTNSQTNPQPNPTQSPCD